MAKLIVIFHPVLMAFSRQNWVSEYHNVSILDFVGANDDGGGDDNCSYKTCKAPVKSSPSTNHRPYGQYK